MKVEVIKTPTIGTQIDIELKHTDEYYLVTSVLSADDYQTGHTNLRLSLDRTIELRDKLTQIIDTEVVKINAQINDPAQVATEIAEVIDGLHKEDCNV
jgi:hypothetical protein